MGIGASAGGLDSLERLFTHFPTDTGMAFVVLQHLYPTKPPDPERLERLLRG